MDDGARAELEATLLACEEVVRECGDSSDPVAQHRAAEALLESAKTLIRLERYGQSVHTLDDLLRRVGTDAIPASPSLMSRALAWKAKALEGSGDQQAELDTLDLLLQLMHEREDATSQRVLGSILTRKRVLLSGLGRPDDAFQVDEAIIDELGRSPAPEARMQVANALRNKAAWLLAGDDRFSEAMAASDELIARLHDEPDESVVTVAEVVCAHIQRLVETGEPTVSSFLAHVVSAVTMISYRTLLGVTARLPVPVRVPAVGSAACKVVHDALPAAFLERLERYEHAVLASDALIARSAASPELPDLRRLAAQSRFQCAGALTALGRIEEAGQILQAESGDPATVQALRDLADLSSQSASIPGQITALSFLASRARALGEGDRRIEQIAYDDSVASRWEKGALRRPAAIYARLMRPVARSRGRLRDEDFFPERTLAD